MAGKHIVILLFLFTALARRAAANAVITGIVFCDQCLDGQVSLLDYPLFGAKVAVTCTAGDGEGVTRHVEQTTGFAGTFRLTLERNLGGEMRRCFVQVVAGPAGCNTAVGRPQELKLLFGMFGTEFYAVKPLLSQPPEPMFFCKHSQQSRSPILPQDPPRSSPLPPSPDNPPFFIPSPPATGPPPPAFACPHEMWTLPEHECHWNVVAPDTTVAMAFGPIAAQNYGTDLTLWEGLHGRGNLSRTLLREGTTALLNSYSSLDFFYPTLVVVDYMNRALLGPSSDAARIALKLLRANSGAPSYGGGQCTFGPCS